MNREDLLEAIGIADETMLEASEKRTKRNWLISVAAACLCCVIGLAAFFALQPKSYRVLMENISWTPGYAIGSAKEDDVPPGGQIEEEDWIDYQFTKTMSIEARVISVLPDTYVALGLGGQAYRVLHLRVLDTIVGEGFPKTIYYLLPAYYDPDLCEYDSLIISLAQCGAEDFILVNVDKQQVESFDFVFRKADYPAYYGAFMAFKRGQLDTSLWDKAGWDARKSLVTDMVNWDGVVYEAYPGKIGRSLSETKKKIRESANGKPKYYLQEVISRKILQAYDGGKEYLQSMKPTKESVVTHYVPGYVNGDVSYCRYIHGFRTNDIIAFDYETGKAYRGVDDVAFTEQDMENLPDLPWAVEHLEEILAEQCPEIDSQKVNITFARYYKHGDAVYGEITIKAPKESDYKYIIAFQDGTISVMTQEEYDARIGK